MGRMDELTAERHPERAAGEPHRAPIPAGGDHLPVTTAMPASLAALASAGPTRAAAHLTGLQRGYGNAAVARMLTAAAPGRAVLARDADDMVINKVMTGRAGSAVVPLPGWGDPMFGDDESVAWFTPYATYKAPLIPVAHGYTTFDQDEGFTGTIKITRAGGQVQLAVDDLFTIDEFADENVTHEFWANWTVTSNKWGELKIGKGQPKRGQTRGIASSAKEVQLTGLETEEHEQENTVVLKATFTGSSGSSTPITVGQNVKKGGTVGGNVSNPKTYAAGTITATFTLHIQVEDAMLGPKSEPRALRKLPLHFKEGAHLLDSRNTVALADFLKQYPNAYKALKDADAATDEGRVRISAFASPKGRPQDNLDLADARQQEVRKRLEQLGVRPGNIVPGYAPGELGKGKGEPAGNDATASEQRVDIEFWEQLPETDD